MKLSWNWLARFVDLDGLSPEDVASAITLAGLEVEGIERTARDLDGVVVGHIVERVPHPDADRLSLCRVDLGEGEPIQVVCGAPNARTGLVAPLATIGTTLPDGLVIRKGKLRGQASFGMLCSGRELGLGDDHEGLLELDGAWKPGTPVAKALGIDDVVLELSITPNRGDCLSVRGVAREIAALLDRELRDLPPPSPEAWSGTPPTVQVRIEAPEGCAHYAALVIEGLSVGPSPDWLRRPLEAIGQRSINNLVDVTNFVLFEMGQPLHAFDLDTVASGQLVVRTARSGEALDTLDGQRRELHPADLVIADGEGPVALAGVMGGSRTEVRTSTRRIALECAFFDPSVVRATRRRHGLSTDSSYRFERGTDASAMNQALARAAELILATQQEAPSDARVQGCARVDARPFEPALIHLDPSLPGRVLGIQVARDRIRAILSSLGMGVTISDEGLCEVEIPGWRSDLRRPIDLVEEVGRMIGYDALPETLPGGRPGQRPCRRADAPVAQGRQPILSASTGRDLERIEDQLVDAGLYQASTLAMVDPDRLARVSPTPDWITLPSPLGRERSVLRTTLLVGLLDAVAHNLAFRQVRVPMFEVAHVFPAALTEAHESEALHLGCVLYGSATDGWAEAPRSFDAWDAAALVVRACAAAGRPCTLHAPTHVPSWAHPGIFARVQAGGRDVGWVGALHPTVGAAWEIPQMIVAAELDLSSLLDTQVHLPRYEPLSRTFGSTRDAAMLVARTTHWEAVESALARLRNPLLQRWELFDVYTGDSIASDAMSLAVRFYYAKTDTSLTDEQVDRAHARTLHQLETEVGAQFRT